ncbi:MAG: [Fe-Fe] hydrogenase large subunit C-terminal domain-containing protein [Clostridia bacterium]|nr:[Fe-Fe] hydrogenase large subunit C-terminal domain-containing protein [Clostridia bacterium]MDD4048063.1 [Fe-Fe] hydrogenase large subunit C-terminal domain-containing protein [Clostridia bacterium]
MDSYFHSVTLDEELCRGCTNCIKHCPTEAIRVRDGKAKIIDERCIDCGECIRICPYHAKLAITDPLEKIKGYEYPIALPAPSLYSQFGTKFTVNHIIAGLLELGFYKVWEVALGAELVTRAVNDFLSNKDFPRPVISSACPAVVKLIQVKFPELINNIVPIKSPMETAAKIAKEEMSKAGYPSEKVGVFFISPCAAKVTGVKNPVGMKNSAVDGVIGISEIYGLLLSKIKDIKKAPDLQKSSGAGVGWAISGGESRFISGLRYLAVDGVENVTKVLEEVVMGKLKEVDFIEALSCVGGCVGGPLTVENPFMAKARIDWLARNKVDKQQELAKHPDWQELMFTEKIKPIEVLKLDDNIAIAMQKMENLEVIEKFLPGLDCGSCGAPTCRALAEDIVRGQADEVDCIFKLREKVTEMAEGMLEISQKMPPSIRKKDK